MTRPISRPNPSPHSTHSVHDARLQSLLDPPIASSGLNGGTELIDTRQHQHTQAHAIGEYAKRVQRIRHSDVHAFTLMGQRYVMKFSRPIDRSRRRAWASSALCGALFGTLPSPKRLLPGDLHHEARRLRMLRQKGVRVPKVHLTTDHHMILEYSGETIESHLATLPPDNQRTQLLYRVVNDLIEFHHAGHWHGGAQVRNLTLKEGNIYRIDFEEQIGDALPLPFAQAFDVLLAFNSLIDHLHGDHHQLGVELLSHYLENTRSDEVLRTLKRLEYWLGFLRRIEPRLSHRLRKKRDLQRARKFAWILNGALVR